jgi:hypothetical protein
VSFRINVYHAKSAGKRDQEYVEEELDAVLERVRRAFEDSAVFSSVTVMEGSTHDLGLDASRETSE